MSGWVLPSLVYIAFLGGLGVTTKLALRHVGWQDVIVWTTIVYLLIAAGMLALGQAKIGFGAGDLELEVGDVAQRPGLARSEEGHRLAEGDDVGHGGR